MALVNNSVDHSKQLMDLLVVVLFAESKIKYTKNSKNGIERTLQKKTISLKLPKWNNFLISYFCFGYLITKLILKKKIISVLQYFKKKKIYCAIVNVIICGHKNKIKFCNAKYSFKSLYRVFVYMYCHS